MNKKRKSRRGRTAAYARTAIAPSISSEKVKFVYGSVVLEGDVCGGASATAGRRATG
jgi:hypothetical protein